jgi:hypothetical protein
MRLVSDWRAAWRLHMCTRGGFRPAKPYLSDASARKTLNGRPIEKSPNSAFESEVRLTMGLLRCILGVLLRVDPACIEIVASYDSRLFFRGGASCQRWLRLGGTSTNFPSPKMILDM